MAIFHKPHVASRLFVTNCQGAICCYDLMISAREEAIGKVVTSNILSANSPACPQNVFHEFSTVRELACQRNVLSANWYIRELLCLLKVVSVNWHVREKSSNLTFAVIYRNSIFRVHAVRVRNTVMV